MAKLPDISDIPSHHRKLSLAALVVDGVQQIRIFCRCPHVAEVPILPLIDKYGPEVTLDHIERLARFWACGRRKDLDARPVHGYMISGTSYST